MSKFAVQYIDPVTDITNQKSEFKLDGKAWRSNLKLLVDLKVASSPVYSELVGAYGLIRHIRLMSRGVELDSCRNANYLMAFKNVNNANEENVGIRSKLSNSSVGYQIDEKLQFEARNVSTPLDVASVENKGSAVLHLNNILPLLKKVEVFNTELFPELRVVVEYNTDEKLKLMDVGDPSTSNRPLLIAEEVQDQAMINTSLGFKGVQWVTVESDQTIIPEQLGAGVQSVVRKINGFDGKKVDRVVMMKHLFPVSKNYNGNDAIGFGAYSSYVQNLEKINFNLNGKPIFPESDGLKDSAQKAMLLEDTWGKCNILPYGNQSGTGAVFGRTQDLTGSAIYGVPRISNTDANPRISERVGAMDYVGFSVADHVNTFELNYERTTLVDTQPNIKPQNESLEIRFFAEVRKSLTVGGGNVTVSYV
jgi:hypothetical protein